MRERMEQRMRAELQPIDGIREALQGLPESIRWPSFPTAPKEKFVVLCTVAASPRFLTSDCSALTR